MVEENQKSKKTAEELFMQELNDLSSTEAAYAVVLADMPNRARHMMAAGKLGNFTEEEAKKAYLILGLVAGHSVCKVMAYSMLIDTDKISPSMVKPTEKSLMKDAEEIGLENAKNLAKNREKADSTGKIKVDGMDDIYS